jgi:exoribonuclease R
LDSDDSKNLYKDGFTQSLSKSPDRRAWSRVSDFIKPFKELTNFHAKVISGMIGLQAATQFRKSLATFLKITPEQILLDFNAHKAALKKFKFNELILLNEQIMIWLNREATQLLDKALIINNLELYLNHLKTEKQNEAIAHFASMLEDKKFSNVAGWILIDSAVIMNLFEQFISNINLLN